MIKRDLKFSDEKKAKEQLRRYQEEDLRRRRQEKIAYLKQRIKELEIELKQLRHQAYSSSIDFAAQDKAKSEMIDTYSLLNYAKDLLIEKLEQ